MNFHQLKYIIAVDRYRNFARAAEECEIAQSTLSKEIQRLEKEFDIIIFDRSRHPVVPTMKGQDLIKQAKIIRENQILFEQIAKIKDNLPRGKFKLGVLSSVAPYLLPLFAQQITAKYADLHLMISEMGPVELANSLENEEIDGAIALAPFEREGFYETTLFDEEFVLYIGKEHSLSQKQVLTWADIPLEELILQEDMKSHFMSNEMIALIKEKEGQGLHKVNFLNGSLETIRKIIDHSGGLTLIPHLACLYMGDRRLQMVKRISAPTLCRKILFITPRGFEKTRISKVLREEIITSVPSGF